MPGAIFIGAGPGIGVSVARRFAREGLPVGVLARSRRTVDAALSAVAGTAVRAHAVTADAADESALRSALDELIARMGVPDVLVYNAAIIQWDSIGELSAAQHLEAWGVNVVGAITAAAHVVPQMAEVGAGTYILTGGMPNPIPQVTSLSLGKAGVRALTELLDTQFRPSGIHVAIVTVCGAVAPGSAFDPDDIAELYWRLHTQPPDAWEREVVYEGRLSPRPAARIPATTR
jgi:NAD(P)-dependent dehydrogenase (short-subunit alcohol dehydrogenase family)